MASTVDLNADLGELPGQVGARIDAAMLRLVTSASVACGGHAGDDLSMRRVCRVAAELSVAIGAHVSYPDREGFGRRPFDGGTRQLVRITTVQVHRLREAAAASDTSVSYIKAHGALYNAAVAGGAGAAEVLVELAADTGLPLLTMPGGALARAAEDSGVPWFSEAFADRSYSAAGALVPRDHPAAVITESTAVAARVHRMVSHGVVDTVDGGDHPVRAHSICFHCDTPGAVDLASVVRGHLVGNGIALRSFLAGAMPGAADVSP